MIGFDTYYYDYGFGTQDGYVDLSLDGGATWGTVWRAPDAFVQGHVEVPVPQAANAKDVRVRFRFSGENDNYWELDTCTSALARARRRPVDSWPASCATTTPVRR